jgi:hypothetical protein
VENVTALRHTFSEWAWQLRVRLDDTRAQAGGLATAAPTAW